MIRNLLYSIFLHIALILAVYFSIESIYVNEPLLNKENHIIVSITNKSVENNLKKKSKTIKPKIIHKKKKAPPRSIANLKKPSPPPPKKITKSSLNKATNILKEPINTSEKDYSVIKFDPKKIYIYEDDQNDLDSLKLSSIYKRSIKNQLNHCFSNILKNQNIKKNIIKKIKVNFQLSKSGVIDFDIDKNFDRELLTLDEYENYKKIIRKIKESTKKCAIFRNLPQNKYHIWKEFNVLFKP
jgi:hypothetical protein